MRDSGADGIQNISSSSSSHRESHVQAAPAVALAKAKVDRCASAAPLPDAHAQVHDIIQHLRSATLLEVHSRPHIQIISSCD